MREKMIQLLKDAGASDEIEKYVDFCIENAQPNKILFRTSHHHILPQAKSLPFTQFSNLNKNEWNGVHLLYKDHFKAHILLLKYFPHYANSSAIAYMLKNDPKNKKKKFNINAFYDEVLEELSETYDSLMNEHYKIQSKQKWVNKDGVRKYVHENELEEYLKKGWCLGSNNKKAKGLITISYNGVVKMVNKQDAIWYFADGWSQGNEKTKEKRKGMVSCYHINNPDKIIVVSKEEFDNNPYLVGSTFKKQRGSNASHKVIIEIYDNKGNLKFTADGDFVKVCKENNLPENALRNSYYTGKPVDYSPKKGTNKKYLSPYYQQFNGWYAIKL